MYRGWDVHAYTQDFNETLTEEQKQLFSQPVDSLEVNAMMLEMIDRFPGGNKALNKMWKRYQPSKGGYHDPDLDNLNVIKICEVVWFKVKSLNDNSIYKIFEEILKDIGGTCIQGDSHRLLMLYYALD